MPGWHESLVLSTPANIVDAQHPRSEERLLRFDLGLQSLHQYFQTGIHVLLQPKLGPAMYACAL